MPKPTGKRWTAAESDAAFDALGDRLIEATRRFSRSARRQRLQATLYTVNGRELGLAQVDALEAVARGDARMHELAAHLGLDPSTVTRTTAPLVDLGLLERFTDPANRRYVVLRCTPAGRRVAARLTNGRQELMRAVLAPMDPQRRLLFAELLDEYIDHIERYQAEHEADGVAD
jgi:DNA-binding MarR family transcriptional regulator